MSFVRRFLGLGLGLFFICVAPALASNHSSAVVSVDTTVPTDDIIDIVLDGVTTTSSTTTTTTTTEAPTTTVAGVLDMGIAAPQFLTMNSDVESGQVASGRNVSVTATGLAPNSRVTLMLQPGNVVLVDVVVDAEGNAVLIDALPSPLASGPHMLVANGITSAGEQVSSAGAFVVDKSGVVTNVVGASESMSAPPTMNDLKRALAAGVPLYDTAANVATTAAVAVGAVVLGTVATGGGGSSNSGGDSGSSDAQSDPRRDSADSSSGSDTSSGGRDTRAEGEVGSIDTDVLRQVDHEFDSWGDRSAIWKIPGTDFSQRIISSVYTWAESHSVVLSRILLDGQWLRATLGPVQLVVVYVGLLLGVLAAVATQAMLLPPLGLVFAIVVFSFIDALAGLMAWLGFVVVVLVRGDISNVFDIRTAVGMAIVFIALPLIANHARPLRRPTNGLLLHRLDRIGDYLLVPIVTAFASSAALSALNGLSGLQLVQPHDASTIRWVCAVAVVSRMATEDVVVRGFPRRLKETHLEVGNGLGIIADYGTVFMKGALFLLASSSFFGLGWRTWVMVVLMTLVPFLKVTQDRYPNVWWLKHWFPQGVLRTTVMIFVGSWFASWILSTSSSPNAAQELAPFLMLPGVALGVVDLFGRSGSKWPNAVWTKLIAAGFWVFVVGVMLGRFSV